MNTLRILFDLAEQKPELSNDFLNEALKQTDKTENEFWKELCKGWQYLSDRVNGNMSSQRNFLIDASFNAQMLSQIFYLAGLKNKEIYSKDGLTKEGLRITFNHLLNYAIDNRLIWYYYSFEGKPFEITYNSSPLKLYELYKVESIRQFKNELKSKKPEQIGEWLNIHLRKFVREGGNKSEWIKHTKQFINQLSIEQQDSFYNWIDANSNELEPKQIETKIEHETENDFTLSTIEDWLFEFKEKMNQTDYQNLVSALLNYFKTGKFPILSKPIQINGRPNKKLFGWALNRIFEAKGKGVEKELLQFAKNNISLFSNVQFDEKNILNSNLYKYFTTQTK